MRQLVQPRLMHLLFLPELTGEQACILFQTAMGLFMCSRHKRFCSLHGPHVKNIGTNSGEGSETWKHEQSYVSDMPNILCRANSIISFPSRCIRSFLSAPSSFSGDCISNALCALTPQCIHMIPKHAQITSIVGLKWCRCATSHIVVATSGQGNPWHVDDV